MYPEAKSLLSGSRGLIYSRDYGKNKLKSIFSVVPLSSRPLNLSQLPTRVSKEVNLWTPTRIFHFVICLLSAAQWEFFREKRWNFLVEKVF